MRHDGLRTDGSLELLTLWSSVLSTLHVLVVWSVYLRDPEAVQTTSVRVRMKPLRAPARSGVAGGLCVFVHQQRIVALSSRFRMEVALLCSCFCRIKIEVLLKRPVQWNFSTLSPRLWLLTRVRDAHDACLSADLCGWWYLAHWPGSLGFLTFL